MSKKKLLAFLDSYTKKHFTDEEKFMTAYKCPLEEVNKQQHALFITKIEEF